MRIFNYFCSKLKDFSNLPLEYVERAQRQIYWKTPKYRANYLPRTIERKKFRYTTNRPWTAQFKQQNMAGTHRKKVFIEPIQEWSYFRGDRVEVLVGKDAGKQGIISQVIPERNWVIVDGLNCHLRKVGAEKNYPGITIKSEAPLLVTCQISLVDPADLQKTDFEWRYTEEGEKVRVSKRSGRIIPIPSSNEETYDYKTKSAYVERDKDTASATVSEITFQPKLRTFEMDLMNEYNIEDNSTPKKTYWY
ncbi:probable 39S ribosomal protein L24, mitochondrial [Condylostylus longicornis]|uniref:probable 39S ribosomal protein L24, mitochondrial n=1 Tax=Condylostylus longicornis TaxID=2530218 RepID=UPI00244E07ED|nr:probable 39S ribosomal protein L24, mitochondrial [Condylostylus longicornis]